MSDFSLDHMETLAPLLLTALARREAVGRAPRRLLEPGLAKWTEFRGNLGPRHLISLVAEDASIRYPLPADPRRVFGADSRETFFGFTDTTALIWLGALDDGSLHASRADAIVGYAKGLGLPSRFAGADLHKVQVDRRVLELPGTGGQLVARALDRSPDAWLHTNTVVLTRDWSDRALAGLVAMEFDTPNVDFIVDDPHLAWATAPENRTRYDLVFGLTPEKGGAWDAATLTVRFPASTIVLV